MGANQLYIGTDNLLKVDRNNKLAIGCSSPVTCTTCHECCYSNDSTVTIAWDLTTITGSVQGGLNPPSPPASLSGSVTIPRNFAYSSNYCVKWQGTDATTANTTLTITSAGAISINVIVGSSTDWLDVRGVNFSDIVLSQANCNQTATYTGVTFQVVHQVASDGQRSYNGYKGTGTITITYNNNRCCDCGCGSVACQPGTPDASGRCADCVPDQCNLYVMPTSVLLSIPASQYISGAGTGFRIAAGNYVLPFSGTSTNCTYNLGGVSMQYTLNGGASWYSNNGSIQLYLENPQVNSPTCYWQVIVRNPYGTIEWDKYAGSSPSGTYTDSLSGNSPVTVS